jgi:indole-3-glycerol phosphate synthase
MTILDEIVAGKREEVARLGPRRGELRAAAEAAPATRPFEAALRRGEEVALIAEVKRRSPSAGWIRRDLEPEAVARAYASAGAAAVSVLTDERYFGGSLEALRAVRAAVDIPVLRKDFIIDPVQVWEARAAGADAVLLIVRILEDQALADLVALCGELGLSALVEVHTREELERALRAGARVIGVNNRDLTTFRTTLEVSLELAPLVPPEGVLVAESGIHSPGDVDRLGLAGVDAVLVGESLMRSADVGRAAAALVGRRRRPRAAAGV